MASSPGVAACFACPGRHVPASGWWWWGFEPVDEAAGFGVEVAHRDEPPVGVFRRPWRRLGGGMRARQLGDLAMSIRGLAAHTSRTASAVIFGSSRSDLGRSAASRSSRPQVTGGAGAGWASTGVSLAGDSRSVTIALPGARGVGTVNRRAGGRRCRRQIAAPAPWSAPRRTPAGRATSQAPARPSTVDHHSDPVAGGRVGGGDGDVPAEHVGDAEGVDGAHRVHRRPAVDLTSRMWMLVTPTASSGG